MTRRVLGAFVLALWCLSATAWAEDDSAAIKAGKLALAEGRQADARAAFGAVLARSPTQPEALYQMGLIHLNNGDYKKAFASFQVLRTVAPDNAEVYYRLAQIYALAGFPDQEVASLKQSVALAPGNEHVHMQLAQTLTARGEYFAASSEYAWLLTHAAQEGKSPDPQAVMGLALLHEQMGQFAEARRLFTRLVGMPDAGSERVNRAQEHLRHLPQQ